MGVEEVEASIPVIIEEAGKSNTKNNRSQKCP